MERRLQSLEKLVAERLPDVNLEEVLKSSSGPAPPSRATPVPAAPTPQPEPQEAPSTDKEEQSAISEAVPDAADGFDWQEEANDLADGMAALSVEPTGTGYLGKPLPRISTSFKLILFSRVYGRGLLSSVSVVLGGSTKRFGPEGAVASIPTGGTLRKHIIRSVSVSRVWPSLRPVD